MLGNIRKYCRRIFLANSPCQARCKPFPATFDIEPKNMNHDFLLLSFMNHDFPVTASMLHCKKKNFLSGL